MGIDSRAWLVIPAYNESATLLGVVEDAARHVGNIVVVDDGSVDGTADTLTGLPITLLTHTVNRGKAASLLDGLRHAIRQGAEHVLTMDGDAQHRADDIPTLLRAAREQPDRLVVGSRFHDPNVIPAGRRRSNRVANF